MSELKETRSGVANENLQEMLDAEANPNNLAFTGQQQYLTPPELADYCNRQLPCFLLDRRDRARTMPA